MARTWRIHQIKEKWLIWSWFWKYYVFREIYNMQNLPIEMDGIWQPYSYCNVTLHGKVIFLAYSEMIFWKTAFIASVSCKNEGRLLDSVFCGRGPKMTNHIFCKFPAWWGSEFFILAIAKQERVPGTLWNHFYSPNDLYFHSPQIKNGKEKITAPLRCHVNKCAGPGLTIA